MRWLFIIFFLITVGWWFLSGQYQNRAEKKPQNIYPQVNITSSVSQKKTATQSFVFIPYWNIPADQEKTLEYDRLIYFGVSSDKKGNIVQDAAYEDIEKFVQIKATHQQMYLTVKLLDQQINEQLLDDATSQEVLASNIAQLAKQYQFDGVALDLEVSNIALFTDPAGVTSLIKSISQEVKNADMSFTTLIYADTYYRSRPYKIDELASISDEIMVMLYDFHKPRGEPGPNFPFHNSDTYGYDSTDLMRDLKRDIRLEKIAIIFGMYGYDWTLGPQGKPLKAAKAIPLYDVKEEIEPLCKNQARSVFHFFQKFARLAPFFSTAYRSSQFARSMPSFSLRWEPSPPIRWRIPSRSKETSSLASIFVNVRQRIARVLHFSVLAQETGLIQNCRLFVDPVSREKKIIYSDSEGYDHVLWYEDKESSQKKIDFFERYGVFTFGYWVWGYYD